MYALAIVTPLKMLSRKVGLTGVGVGPPPPLEGGSASCDASPAGAIGIGFVAA